jgi:hypothetical protein
MCVTGFSIKCERCGGEILLLFDLGRAQKCPTCDHLIAGNVVDLSDRTYVRRRLKSVLEREAKNRRTLKL